jgi:hypothetical protein
MNESQKVEQGVGILENKAQRDMECSTISGTVWIEQRPTKRAESIAGSLRTQHGRLQYLLCYKVFLDFRPLGTMLVMFALSKTMAQFIIT